MYKHETFVRVRYSETDKMGYCYYGNYAQFYLQVKKALSGGVWPVSVEEIITVATIIDQAREISFR